MLNGKTLVAVYVPWSEDESRACLVDVDFAAIGDLLDQVQEVQFKGLQTWVLFVRSDVLYDHLSLGEEGEQKVVSEVLVTAEVQSHSLDGCH